MAFDVSESNLKFRVMIPMIYYYETGGDWFVTESSWTDYIGNPEHKWETKGGVVTLRVIVPGAKKEGIRVYIKENKYLCVSYVGGKESSVKDFDSKWSIPDTWNLDDIESKYENGILSVSVSNKKVEEKEVKVK